VFKIDKEDTKKDRANEHIDAGQGNALFPKQKGAKKPKQEIGDLHRRIAKGNVRFAPTAFTTKHHVGQNGNIIIPP
jgi:hypothetical protein